MIIIEVEDSWNNEQKPFIEQRRKNSYNQLFHLSLAGWIMESSCKQHYAKRVCTSSLLDPLTVWTLTLSVLGNSCIDGFKLINSAYLNNYATHEYCSSLFLILDDIHEQLLLLKRVIKIYYV